MIYEDLTFGLISLFSNLGSEYDIQLPFNCTEDILYLDNKIADIILKFADNSIVNGKQ